MTDPPTRRFRWGRLCLAVLFSLVLMEVGVRVAEAVTGVSWALPAIHESRESVYQPHPYIGWSVRPDTTSDPLRIKKASTNNLGFRGTEDVSVVKPPRTFRIACLGGSTTWSTGATHDDSAWPSVLQRMLEEKLEPGGPYDHVEVLNAGVSGYSLMESFINLKMRVLPLDPDLVILYHAVNDAQHLRRGQFQTDYSHVRRSWTDKAPPSLLSRLLGWSHTYGLLVGAPPAQRRDTIGDRVQVADYDALPIRQKDAIEPGVRNFAWTLREAIALCRLRGADVALASFAWAREGVGDTFKKKASLVDALGRMNQAIRAVAQQEDTLFVELHEYGPKALNHFDDMVHFNDAGNRLAAAIFAQAIRASGILQRAPGPPPPMAPVATEPRREN